MKKEKIILIAIFLLGLALRSYGCWNITEYLSSDSAQQVFMSLNIFNFKTLFALDPTKNIIAAVFSYPYGFFTITLYWILFSLLSLFKIPLAEPFVFFLIAFMGSLIIIGVYLLVKELTGNVKLALLSALYVCIEPNLISQSRIAGMNILVALSLEVFAVYFAVKYFKCGKTLDGFLASLFIALFFGASNIAFSIVLLILYIGFLYTRNIKQFFKLTFRPVTMILPAFVFVMYILVFYYALTHHNIDLSSNVIGKMVTKPKVLGFYGLDVAGYYIENCGIVLLGLFIIGALYGIYKTWKLAPESVLLVWCFIFTYPFVFFTPPYATVVKAFMSESQLCLGILGVMALYRLGRFKCRGNPCGCPNNVFIFIILILLYITTFIFTIGFVYNLPYYKTFSLGSVRYITIPETGAKAAGFYVRENIPESKKVFTDLEPIQAQYYFGRNKVYCRYDADLVENLRYFKEVMPGMDYVILNAADMPAYANILTRDKFLPVVIIAKQGKAVRYIFEREKTPGKMLIVDKADFDKKFNDKYATFTNLLPYKMDYPSANCPKL